MADDKDVNINIKGKDLTGDTFSRVREKMEVLKQSLGRRSGFGESIELLKGAGAIVGITESARMLGEMARNANEVREQWHQGAIDAEAMRDSINGAIPGLGTFWTAGRNIREWFTGEREELDASVAANHRLVEQQKELNDYLREAALLHRQMREEIDQMAEATKHAHERGLKGEVDRSTDDVKAQDQAEATRAKNEIDQTRADAQNKLAAIRQEMETLKRHFGRDAANYDLKAGGKEGMVHALMHDRWDRIVADSTGMYAGDPEQIARFNELRLQQETILKTSNARAAQIDTDSAAKRKQIAAKGAADKKDILEKDRIDQEEKEKDHAEHMAQIHAQAQDVRLKGIARETEQIKAETDQQIAQIQREADAMRRDHPERAAKIKQDAAAEIAATGDLARAREADAMRRDNIDRIAAQKESAQRIAAIKSETLQQSLREQGKELAAELEQIRENEKEKIAAAEKARDDAIRAHPEREKDLRKSSADEIAAIHANADAARAAAQRKNRNAQLDKQTDIDRQAADARAQALRDEASLGSKAAEIEAQRNDIARKFADQRTQINRQLREDLSLTQAQRDTLNQLLHGLDAQEAKEKAIAAAKARMDMPITAHAEQSRSLSGVISRARTAAFLASGNFASATAGAAGAGIHGATARAAAEAAGGGAGGKDAAARNAEKAAQVADQSKAIQQQMLDALKMLVQMAQQQPQTQGVFLR